MGGAPREQGLRGASRPSQTALLERVRAAGRIARKMKAFWGKMDRIVVFKHKGARRDLVACSPLRRP